MDKNRNVYALKYQRNFEPPFSNCSWYMLRVFLGSFIWKRHRDLRKCRISLEKNPSSTECCIYWAACQGHGKSEEQIVQPPSPKLHLYDLKPGTLAAWDGTTLLKKAVCA